MGRVRSKSKRAAFSISSANEGGAQEREVAAITERDDERERIWDLESFGRVGIWGMEIWIGILGFEMGEGEEEEMGTLEEAMIMLAMATLLLSFWFLFVLWSWDFQSLWDLGG